MVYLYVNDYTQDVVEHLRAKIREEPETYGATLFALCDPKAFKAGNTGDSAKADNIMHVMYAANADGVTSAGFGTTSEFYYLHKQGYEGKFIVAPVENQHEQGANAAELKSLCGDSVRRADGIEQVKEQLGEMIADRVVASRSESASGWRDGMKPLTDAASREAAPGEPALSNVGHAAELLDAKTAAMSEKATRTVTAMAHYDATDAPKERRRVYKLLVPALDALIADAKATPPGIPKQPPTATGDFQVLAKKSSGEPKPMNVAQAIELMRAASEVSPEGDQALKDLLDIDIKNTHVKSLLAKSADKLEALMDIDNLTERSAAASRVLHDLAHDDVALGW